MMKDVRIFFDGLTKPIRWSNPPKKTVGRSMREGRSMTIIEAENKGMSCEMMRLNGSCKGLTYRLYEDRISITDETGEFIVIGMDQLYRFEDYLFALFDIWQKYVVGESTGPEKADDGETRRAGNLP